MALRRAILLALLAPFAGSAWAQEAIARWSCWYDEEVSIVCFLVDAPAVDAAQKAALGDMLARVSAAPSDSPLPPLIRLMRSAPGAFERRLVTIPLHSEPDDMAFVYELAVSVMCGSNARCAVNWVLDPATLALAN